MTRRDLWRPPLPVYIATTDVPWTYRIRCEAHPDWRPDRTDPKGAEVAAYAHLRHVHPSVVVQPPLGTEMTAEELDAYDRLLERAGCDKDPVTGDPVVRRPGREE